MPTDPAAPPRVAELLQEGTALLSQQGIEAPRLQAEHLLAHQLNLPRLEILWQRERPVPATAVRGYRADLQRRAEGIPLQHLLGSVEFFGLRFLSDARALIPRPETEILVQRCLELPLPDNARMLDVGCGSGVIGLSLAAARPDWKVSLLDQSPAALELSRENAEKLVSNHRISLIHNNLLEPNDSLPADARFELIVANLPYIPTAEIPDLAAEVQHDPPQALDGGPDGLDLIRRLILALPVRLAPGGWVALEVGHDQGPACVHLLQQVGLKQVDLWADLEGIARFPHARHG